MYGYSWGARAYSQRLSNPDSLNTKIAGKMTDYSQTQWFGRFLLVMTRTLPAERAIGIAQQTTRGVERPLLLIVGSWNDQVVVVGVTVVQSRIRREAL